MRKSPYFWNVIAMACLLCSQSLALLGGGTATPVGLHVALLVLALGLGLFSAVQLLREHRNRSREASGHRYPGAG